MAIAYEGDSGATTTYKPTKPEPPKVQPPQPEPNAYTFRPPAQPPQPPWWTQPKPPQPPAPPPPPAPPKPKVVTPVVSLPPWMQNLLKFTNNTVGAWSFGMNGLTYNPANDPRALALAPKPQYPYQYQPPTMFSPADYSALAARNNPNTPVPTAPRTVNNPNLDIRRLANIPDVPERWVYQWLQGAYPRTSDYSNASAMDVKSSPTYTPSTWSNYGSGGWSYPSWGGWGGGGGGGYESNPSWYMNLGAWRF